LLALDGEGPGGMASGATTSFVLMATLFVMAMTLVMTPTMPMIAAVISAPVLVMRHVFVVVPVVSHKVDRPAAGVVLRAMLAPVFLVAPNGLALS
jgi:hypothetical protein